MIPALLIKISIGPTSLSILLIASITSLSMATLNLYPKAVIPYFLNSNTASSIFGCDEFPFIMIVAPA